MRTTALPLALATLAGALALQAPAGAQTAAGLLRDPWKPEDHWSDTRDKPILFAPGRLDDGGGDVAIFHWDSAGRIKFDRTDRQPDVWMGYRLLAISVRADLPAIDHTFYDTALAVAGRLGSLGGDWTLKAAAGMGTANDGSFRNADALYPVAAITASQAPGAPARWTFGLSHDGNETLLPALPVPVVACELEPDPAVRLRLGIPRTEVVVRPADGLAATIRWDYPVNALARLEQELGAGFRLFAEGNRRVDGFHMRESGSTRMFYELNAAEAGLRWVASWIDVSLSAGYAFEQTFFTGYDLRNRDTVGSPEDRPYVALTVQGTF